jgi:hypothetical protein
MPKVNIAKMSIQNIEWSSKSSRKPKPCSKCSQPTTGRVGREPLCLECVMRRALAPVASMTKALTGGK